MTASRSASESRCNVYADLLLKPLSKAVWHPADFEHPVEVFGPVNDHRLQIVALDRLRTVHVISPALFRCLKAKKTHRRQGRAVLRLEKEQVLLKEGDEQVVELVRHKAVDLMTVGQRK